MKTKRFEKDDLKDVVALIKKGGVVAFPTDTVYGLGVIYDNEVALKALKESKGRADHKPIPTMVASITQMKSIAYMSEEASALAHAFMPGAFTMILKKKECVESYLTNGFDTIGIRMPDDGFVLALIEECGKAMLVTSANLSGCETGLCDKQVLSQLDGRMDAIVMGEAQGSVASTIVDASKDTISILREGPITKAMIENELGHSL